MLLNEIAVASPGHWKHIEHGGTRQWIPVFQGKCITNQENCIPSEYTNFTQIRNAKSTFNVNGQKVPFHQSQAYQLWATKKANIPANYKKLIDKNLADALKRRSETDYISDEHFNILMDRCANICIMSTPLKSQDGRRIVLVTPESSSPVARMFTHVIQQKLKVPLQHVFTDHISKRDVTDIFMDVEGSDISPESKEEITKRLQWGGDERLRMKHMRFGHRNEMQKAGVQMFQPRKRINAPPMVPWLVIVDDNVQTNVTSKQVAQTVISHTQMDIGNIASLAMYNYGSPK